MLIIKLRKWLGISCSLIFSLSLVSCGAQIKAPDTAPEELPSLRQLNRNLRNIDKVLWVYASQDPQSAKEYHRLGQKLEAQFSENFPFEIRPDTSVSDSELVKYPLYLVGSAAHNQVLARALPALPFDLQADRFSAAGKAFEVSNYLLKLGTYPSPFNANLPIWVLSGADDVQIIETWQGDPDPGFWFIGGGSYEFFEEGQVLLKGLFSRESHNRWQLDPQLMWSFKTGGDADWKSRSIQVQNYHSGLSQAELAQIAKYWEGERQRLNAFLGDTSQVVPAAIEIYPSAEFKGLRTRYTEPVTVNYNKGSIALVYDSSVDDLYWGLGKRLWLRQQLGKPKIPMLEVGLAIYLSPDWQGEGYAQRMLGFYHAQAIPGPRQLIESDAERVLSPLVGPSAAALWVEFLIQTWGKMQFLNQYTSWEPSPKVLARMEKAWQAFLKAKFRTLTQGAQSLAPQNDFCKGFNFAHEGYSIYNGYGSQEATASLTTLRAKGANAITIVPYSYLRDPHTASPLPIPRRSGSETDEGVIHSIHAADSLGLEVLLKPQIWISGSWPGDVAMDNEADWQRFFDYYEAWIMHYALLAEIHEVPMLSVGVEFTKATLSHPDNWREIIQKVRKVYHGKLVYSANWGKEFEQLSFWDELDFIGIDCYYPLGKDPSADKTVLKAKFEEVLSTIERVHKNSDKPIFFTEIGYRSIDAPWQQPHESAGSKASNVEHQKLCYSVVIEALEGKDWCKGLFWWKWPSYMDHGHPEDRRFSPAGKPAMEVVEKWFEEN